MALAFWDDRFAPADVCVSPGLIRRVRDLNTTQKVQGLDNFHLS